MQRRGTHSHAQQHPRGILFACGPCTRLHLRGSTMIKDSQ
jgi:hypothetical protein